MQVSIRFAVLASKTYQRIQYYIMFNRFLTHPTKFLHRSHRSPWPTSDKDARKASRSGTSKATGPQSAKFRFGEVSGLGTEMKVSTQKKVSLGIQSSSEHGTGT